jgi:hypothetical protein
MGVAAATSGSVAADVTAEEPTVMKTPAPTEQRNASSAGKRQLSPAPTAAMPGAKRQHAEDA